jgi:hypothetical protein
MAYEEWQYEHKADGSLCRNWYGRPIVSAEHFEGRHETAMVPASGGNPPVCACGWTRESRYAEDVIELYQHQLAQAPEFRPLWMLEYDGLWKPSPSS